MTDIKCRLLGFTSATDDITKAGNLIQTVKIHRNLEFKNPFTMTWAAGLWKKYIHDCIQPCPPQILVHPGDINNSTRGTKARLQLPNCLKSKTMERGQITEAE
ncbi:hypothetical protein ACJMK2_002440 [Sinanodonta woodiana]|uniref:Uncharacterized protein n=1 Tax=Sinanodonta woodiana TaxID=1069815 RepID=A0ABD3XXJ8_SINWO